MTARLRNVGRRFTARWFDDAPSAPLDRGRGPRIVILSASVGAGHIRAAQAIESALGQVLPNATIAHVDVLQFTNRVFRRVYSQGYFKAVATAPKFVGFLYDALDHPYTGTAGETMRLGMERANFLRLTRFLTSNQWDLAINTHFLPAGLIAWMRRKELVNFPHLTVTTDFDVHGLWITHPCEGYFVATEEGKNTLVSADVDSNDVVVSGIPIDPVFAEPKDLIESRRKHGLATDRPMVFQMAGGFGIGSVERIYRAICDIRKPLQICVVAGKNESAAERLRKINIPERHQARIIGFTTEIDEFLAAADVIVSKPGGLTTSESLARGCPMVIAEPIPGQEDRNSDFLLENGCGIKANSIATLGHKLESLLSNPVRLRTMRAAATNQGRPSAAFDVARHCAAVLNPVNGHRIHS
ncbi:MAG TPA: glycosyltransferase [Tepidisphaeraceae bacterium]|nr:glycosyltransferase [Tepidisphaeraceae bacterium]